MYLLDIKTSMENIEKLVILLTKNYIYYIISVKYAEFVK